MRIRLKDHSDGVQKAYMTIKYELEEMIRKEWEFEIDYVQAQSYYRDLCDNKMGLGHVFKTRHIIYNVLSTKEFYTWEIDVFHDDNEGLIMAEIELPWRNAEFDKLECLGKEVTNDKRYYNAYLAEHPYKEWEDERRQT